MFVYRGIDILVWFFCLSLCLLVCVVVSGGEIVSTFGNPEKVKLGHCKLIEEVMIGEDKVRFSQL